MTGPMLRRPLPALISLVALLLLTAIVWWRVLNRDTGEDKAESCPTPTPTPTSQALPAPGTVTLQVLNSTNRTGIAADARRQLMQAGFKVPKPAGNDKASTRAKNKGTAQIRYPASQKRAAALVGYYFPGAALVATKDTSSTIVVALGAKYKKVASATSVTRALRADKRSVAPTAPAPAPSASGTC